MNEKAEILFTRRSLRKYAEGPAIGAEDLHFLLNAAMCAPSAHNRQPWHFVVITDRPMLLHLASVHPYAKMLKQSVAAILVCGSLEDEPEEGYLVQACSAATQNVLLACEAINLGAVWLGIHPRTERMEMIRKLLDIPAGVLPVSLVSIGYPAEAKPRNANFKQSRVHLNYWGAGQ